MPPVHAVSLAGSNMNAATSCRDRRITMLGRTSTAIPPTSLVASVDERSRGGSARERDEPVEHVGIGADLDLLGERAPGAGLRRDQVLGDPENIRGDLVADLHLLPGGDGQVPGVNEE